MVSVATYLGPFKTSTALSSPIVIKDGGINWREYVFQLEITAGVTTLGMGHLGMITTTVLTAGVTVAKDFKTCFVVMDTAHNKTLLEAAGTTIAWGAVFAAGDKVDCLFLVPGMVLALFHDGVAALDIGEKVRVAAAGLVATMAAIATDADPRTQVGMSLTRLVGTTGTGPRIAVMIGA